MLTEFEIQKIATAVVDRLSADDKFTRKMAEMMPRRQGLISSRTAAALLGISRKSVCDIAKEIGGIRGKGPSAHWMFNEDGLVDRYLAYKSSLNTLKNKED